MSTVSKEDAFREIIKSIEKGDYECAQKMLNIVSNRIQEEKKQGTYSDNLELRTRREESVFQDLLKTYAFNE